MLIAHFKEHTCVELSLMEEICLSMQTLPIVIITAQ